MVSEAILQKIKRIVPQENIAVSEPMAGHTTFKIGGPADCLIQITETEQLCELLRLLRLEKVPFFILGNGSNLLVSDEGYRGVILKIGPKMGQILVAGTEVTAQAGASMASVARTCLEHGLAGFEFAAGIPGTIGGGIVMNAGAYGGELKDIVKTVTVLTEAGECKTLSCQEMCFSYRDSIAKHDGSVILSATFCLREGNREEIKALMEDLAGRRRDKQPLEFPSAGSTFKRPEGYFAGKLIMDAGLRGFQVGGARVSDKHCGFVINAGGATAEDVRSLMEQVTEKVKEEFQVELEPEVLFLGF